MTARTQKPSILVTGCAGFIGANFVRSFAKRFPKICIIGLDNFSTGRRDALNDSLTLYEGSITDEKLTDKIFKKHRPLFVFHFAALPAVSYSVEHPYETTLVNTAGTAGLLEMAVRYGTKRFMLSSTAAVYGTIRSLPIKESDETKPLSPYGAQKLASENLCAVISQLHGLETVCLRYSNAFGPGQYGGSAYANVISGWLEALFFPQKKKLFIEGDGKQSRDFCYVDNIVNANINAMQAAGPFQGTVINVGSGEQTSLNELKGLIEKVLKKKLSCEKRPARNGDIRHTRMSITRARRLINYVPAINFEEGLIRTVAWFESRRNT